VACRIYLRGTPVARISEDVKAAVLADLRKTTGTPEGSCRKVAERHGIGMTVVREIAKAASLSFGVDAHAARARTKSACEVNEFTNAQLREQLSARLLREAKALLDWLNEPVHVYGFGGQYHSFAEADASSPSPSDKRQLITAAAIALDKHVVLERFDSAGAAGQQADLLLKLLTGQADR
jgi:hypothetical protein